MVIKVIKLSIYGNNIDRAVGISFLLLNVPLFPKIQIENASAQLMHYLFERSTVLMIDFLVNCHIMTTILNLSYNFVLSVLSV